MRISDVITLAFESLRENKLRSFLTVLGMVIGVAAVVLLVSIGQGAKRFITAEFEGLGTNIILVQPGKTDAKSSMGPPISSSKGKLTLSDVEALKKQAYTLSAVSGIMFTTCVVKFSGETLNVHMLGTNEQFQRIFNINISLGSYLSQEEADSGRRVIVLGNHVAEKLFGTENPLGQLVKVNESEHRVVGVVKKTGDKLGFNVDEMVIIPDKSAMRLMNTNKLFGIRAQSRNRAGIDDATKEISTILKSRHNGEEDFTLITQVSMMETMNNIMVMLTYMLAGIAMISMLVGGIGIMNIMLVSVTERTREIGIRRAVGAKSSDILKQFLTEAVELALFAGSIGIIIALIMTHGLYYFVPKFDMRPPWWILLPAFLMSLITGIVFGVWPARKASKIQTIEALRYE